MVLDGSLEPPRAAPSVSRFAQGRRQSGSRVRSVLQQRDVARAARRQNGYPQADRFPPQLQHKQISKMMAERRLARQTRTPRLQTVIYSRRKPWKSTISS